jgi:uncharacterized protein YwgA
MGKGLALEFKKRFPDMFQDYQNICKKEELKLGQPYLYKSLIPPWILNFPTKGHWRAVSRVEDIVKGLEYLVEHYKKWGITSLAIPPLGCGYGQLEWDTIGPILTHYLSLMDIPVEIYAPYEIPETKMQLEPFNKETKNNLLQKASSELYELNSAWVIIVEILNRIEKQPYHWPIGRTTFQKIAFVTNKEGIPTGLNYQKASYGPFAPELKSHITRMVNNGLIKEEPLGKMFEVKVGPAFENIRKKYIKEIEKWDKIINKIVDLFMRIKTDQAEITATVLFATDELKTEKQEQPTETEVLDYVMKWKKRRRPPVNKEAVASTIRNLAVLDWLKVKPSTDLPLFEEAWL